MRILVVEDEAAVLILAESVLHGAGHETFTAATVEQALAILQSDKPLELLFTDLGLDNDREAGLHLAQEARRIRPGLRVIYTSGQALTDGMKELFVDGYEFVPKPYTVDQLRAAVDSTEQGRSTPH